jgi:opacity protein-like surface antigen
MSSIIFIGDVMKFKHILAIAALLVTGVANAQLKGYASVEYYDEHNRVTEKDNIKGAVVAGVKTQTNWDYSLKMESSQAELGNGTVSTGVETRIRKSFPNALGIFSPWAGIRLGQSIKSTEHFGYYAAEGGLKFPLVGALSGDVGYRYKDAFNKDAQQTDRYYALVNYAITKQDSVSLRFSRSYGDEEKDAWRLSYTRSF